MNTCKKLLILFTALLSFALCGCFHGNVEMTVNKDGSMHNKYRFTGNGFMQGQIKKLRAEMADKGEIKDVVDGNTKGFELEINYPSIDAMAKEKDNFTRANKGKNLGVVKKSGWFFDDYRFDFLMKGDGREADASMMSDVSLMFTISFLEVAKNHNADIESPDGRTLTWNLLTSLITEQDKYMKADFRIYHKDHIVMTAIVAIILVALAIFLFVKAKKAAADVEGTDGQTRRVSLINQIPAGSKALIAAAILIAVYAAYSFNNKPTFNEADSISYVAEQNADAGETKK